MDLSVEFWQGGKEEFKRTGIYPQWLYFSSKELNCSWSVRFNKKLQIGCLKIDNKTFYNYVFTESKCEVQEVQSNVACEWIEVTVITIICD